MRITAASIVLVFSLSFSSAHALSHHEDQGLDSAGLAMLEQRAEHAQAREQAFLYTELVGFYTELAGKEIAAGDLAEASTSIQHIQHFTERIHSGIARDTRKVKDAEMLLHTAAFHLSQSLRSLSAEDKSAMEATLHQLEKVHDELLAQVFAH